MTLFDDQFFHATAWLRQLTGRHWRQRLLGQRPSTGVHAGTEVTDVCDYSMGHDPRYIDWNRCARLDELVTKQFHGNQLQRLDLWLDVSRSMEVGDPVKFDQTRRLAAHLAAIALENGESVRLFGVAEGIRGDSPPFHQLRSLPRVCQFLEDLQPAGGAVDFAAAAAGYLRSQPLPATVIIVGDLIDLEPSRFPAGVQLLTAQGRPTMFLQCFDRCEAEPDLSGPVKLTDIEQSGWSVGVDLTTEDRKLYREVFAEYCAELRYFCRQAGVGLLQVDSGASPADCLETMLRITGAAA